MHESPNFVQEGIKKTAGMESSISFHNDDSGIRKIIEIFTLANGKDIIGKMSGTEYKYIFTPTQNGWSLSEESIGEDGTTYFITINLRDGRYELFKNSVKNGKGNPTKSPISPEAAKDYIGDLTHKIILINAGRQTSSLEDGLALA